MGYGNDVGVVRSFLVEHRILPTRDEYLARLEGWVSTSASEILDPSERRAYLTFAQWRHLPRLRNQSNPVLYGQMRGVRSELVHIIEFTNWLRTRGTYLANVMQLDIDKWLATGPISRDRIKHFLEWTRTNGINIHRVIFPARPTTGSSTTAMPRDQINTHLERTMDHRIPISGSTRFAAGLILLHGIRIGQVATLRVSDLTVEDTLATVKIGSAPLKLRPVLVDVALEALIERSAPRLIARSVDSEWLFPGAVSGNHLTTTALAARLKKLGIRTPSTARKGALLPLAQLLPAPVLAALLGMHPGTASNWKSGASASNARYAAIRFARGSKSSTDSEVGLGLPP